MEIKGIYSDVNEIHTSTPEIIKIEAQFEEIPCTLVVTIEFEDNYKLANVLFKNVQGFRVLNEGDQLMFWQKENMPSEWIWEIVSGGWFDIEAKNGEMTMLRTISDQLKEYLVIGVGMCVNVICKGDDKPIVTLAD